MQPVAFFEIGGEIGKVFRNNKYGLVIVFCGNIEIGDDPHVWNDEGKSLEKGDEYYDLVYDLLIPKIVTDTGEKDHEKN